MAIKKLSTLPSLSAVRPSEILNPRQDVMEMSLSGVPGAAFGTGDEAGFFSVSGWASSKIQLISLFGATSAEFFDSISAEVFQEVLHGVSANLFSLSATGTFTGSGEYVAITVSGNTRYIPLYTKSP
jgi:hypothetical protein